MDKSLLNFEHINQQPIHFARLISVTRPIEEVAKELGINSAEHLLTYVARVSNPSNQSNENINKLIAYCCKNKHFSILETITFTVEITTTKDVSSQILRHNSLRFQEFSYRYADSTYLKNPYEIPELRIQDTKDRQKSITVNDNRFDDLNERVKKHLEETYNLYNVLLNNGVAKECARRILPVSMVTRLYATGNVRDFAFYIKARNSKDGKAQVEHQKVADSIEAIFKEQFPIVYNALFND